MKLENYRDVSNYGGDSPGFQFDFSCSNCGNVWKSQYKPYRKGQVAGFLSRIVMHVQGVRNVGFVTRSAAEMGLEGAKKAALAEAIAQAESIYTVCPECQQAACGSCYVAGRRMCKNCINRAENLPGGISGQAARGQAARAPSQNAAAAALSCPNCRAAHAGGRFCAECGFDMASTHKSCPDCGAMALRQARFCNDCGHGF
jgi:Double zinc ribbon